MPKRPSVYKPKTAAPRKIPNTKDIITSFNQRARIMAINGGKIDNQRGITLTVSFISVFPILKTRF